MSNFLSSLPDNPKAALQERKRQELANRLRRPNAGHFGTNKNRVAMPKVTSAVESAAAGHVARSIEATRQESREALANRIMGRVIRR